MCVEDSNMSRELTAAIENFQKALKVVGSSAVSGGMKSAAAADKKFAIKGTIYTPRKKFIDGPWATTVEGAVKALADMLEKKGLDHVLFQYYVAEKAEKDVATSQDGKGVYYNSKKPSNLDELLEKAGITPGN
jgi:hypothetical protein